MLYDDNQGMTHHKLSYVGYKGRNYFLIMQDFVNKKLTIQKYSQFMKKEL